MSVFEIHIVSQRSAALHITEFVENFILLDPRKEQLHVHRIPTRSANAGGDGQRERNR